MEDVRVAKRCNAWYVGIFIRLKEKRRRENLKIMLSIMLEMNAREGYYIKF